MRNVDQAWRQRGTSTVLCIGARVVLGVCRAKAQRARLILRDWRTSDLQAFAS